MFLGCFLYESVRIFSSYICEQIVFVHDSEHFLVIHGLSFLLELHGDDSVSVLLVVFFHKFPDELQIRFFLTFLGLSQGCLLLLLVISGKRNLSDLAKKWDRIFPREFLKCLESNFLARDHVHRSSSGSLQGTLFLLRDTLYTHLLSSMKHLVSPSSFVIFSRE